MKILVTGSNGFIGKNLISELKNRGYKEIFEYDINKNIDDLNIYLEDCDFVFHLAGINRPQNQEEFMKGNYEFTLNIINILKKYDNKCPIMYSSSIQALLNNPYGESKKAAEDILLKYGKESDVKILIYRFPNVFGKWCRPNYNSVVATFCNNIANNLPITVNDPDVLMNLAYIDDIVAELINALNGKENKVGDFCEVPVTYERRLGEIADHIMSFRNSRNDLTIPKMSDSLVKKLYSTYLSYLPKNDFSYPLKMNIDNRGSFTEFIKNEGLGQLSVNISKPGIIKGNHWHHTKVEKFLVVSGKGVIRFRKIDSDEIIEYFVSSDKLEVVDIPVGYTHSIENLGNTDMVTVVWANESFNPDAPDTYFEEV